MSDLISYIKSLYYEGQRYNLLNSFSGTLAKLGVPLEVAVEFYYDNLYLQDDENREHIIRYTYEKYSQGKPIQTLHSLKDLPEFQKLYYLTVRYFGKYKIVKPAYTEDDLDLSLDTDKENMIDLGKISYPISQHTTPLAYKYLQSRKITDENIRKYNIRVGKGSLKEYILFPVFEKNKCVYYVGRNYVGGKPRYKNAQGNKSDYLWFSDNNLNVDTIVICEGIINAITVANYTNLLTCAVFGKTISQRQLIKLQRFDNIILNFDSDVSRDYIVKSILPKFSGKNVSIIEMLENKDANDLNRQEYLQCFLNRKQIDEFSLINF